MMLPNVELAKGESVELSVTATVPDGKECRLKNTAVMTFPTANTRFNKDPGDDAASATAKIPSKTCVKPDRPQCEPKTNEFRSESGACVCKSGYLRDEKGHCVGVVEAPRCPDGKPVPKSGRCPEASPQCEPGQNEQRNEQGQCVCKSGYERDTRGRCIEPPSPADDCKEKGWNWTGTRCVEPPNPAEECEDRGWIWNDRAKRCSPPPNPAEECEDRGWIWNDKAKRCLPPPNPAEECRKKGWLWDDKRDRACRRLIRPRTAEIRDGFGTTSAACRRRAQPTNAGRRAGSGTTSAA